MIAGVTDKSVVDRKDVDTQVAREVVEGSRQVAFASEFNPAIKVSLEWFSGIVEEWDLKSAESHSLENRMEHIEAFALQRDINYAYASRKRLMDIGHDSQLEEPFMAKIKALTNKA